MAARLALFAVIHHRGLEVFYSYSDGQEYLTVAYNLLAGNGFSVRTATPFWPSSYYVPGYPYTLFGLIYLGLGVRTLILFQVLIGAAVAGLVAWRGKDVVGQRAAIVAGIFLAIEPSTIFWNNQLVTETISSALWLVAFFLLLRFVERAGWWRAVLVGFMLGASTLYRHAGQFLLPLFAVAFVLLPPFSWKRRVVAAVLCFVCGIALLVPWTLQNEKVFGIRFFSTASGALGIGKNLQYYAQQVHHAELFTFYNVPGPTTEESQHPWVLEYNIIRKAQAMPRLALQILLEDPLGLIQVYSGGLIPFFLGDGFVQIATVAFASQETPLVVWDGQLRTLWQQVSARPDMLLFLFGKVAWFGLTLAAVWGTLRMFAKHPERRRILGFVVLLIFYYAVASGVSGYSRFRFPVTPLILLLAASGMADVMGTIRRWWQSWQSKRSVLVVTQVMDRTHHDLGFFHEWVNELASRADKVTVLTLREGEWDLPEQVDVEAPAARWKVVRNIRFVLRMWWLILRHKAVFFHMCPEYAIAGAPLARLLGRKTLLWYTHRSVTRRLRLAVALTDRTYTAAKESCAVDSPRVEVTGHGIPIPEHVVSLRANGTVRLLSIGRISPIKAFHQVIDAAAQLIARGISVELSIVGAPMMPTDPQYHKELMAQVERLGLGARVHFLGAVPPAQVAQLFAEHDLLVNMSANGPDKVVYEAAAHGLPVIAALPAFVPLFGSHAPLLHVPVGNVEALVDHVASFSGLPLAERVRLAADLRAGVMVSHSLGRLIDRIAAFLLSEA